MSHASGTQEKSEREKDTREKKKLCVVLYALEDCFQIWLAQFKVPQVAQPNRMRVTQMQLTGKRAIQKKYVIAFEWLLLKKK